MDLETAQAGCDRCLSPGETCRPISLLCSALERTMRAFPLNQTSVTSVPLSPPVLAFFHVDTLSVTCSQASAASAAANGFASAVATALEGVRTSARTIGSKRRRGDGRGSGNPFVGNCASFTSSFFPGGCKEHDASSSQSAEYSSFNYQSSTTKLPSHFIPQSQYRFDQW